MEKGISDIVREFALQWVSKIHVSEGFKVFMQDYIPQVIMILVALAFLYIVISETTR